MKKATPSRAQEPASMLVRVPEQPGVARLPRGTQTPGLPPWLGVHPP